MSRLTHAARRVLGRVLFGRDYRVRRVSDVCFLEPLLYRLLKRRGRVFFVQIGANDGRRSDPLYRFVTLNHSRICGVVVEPLTDYFDRLQANYRKYPQIVAVRAAIHNSEKEMTLYRVDPARLKDLPDWAAGVASFDKRHHERSGIPSDAIMAERVPCMTLGELLTRHEVAEIDLLQIDTEGYDAEILSHLDFDTIRPAIVRFEHGLSEGIMSRETFSAIADLLHRQGYELAMEEHDATAYQREIMTT
jgi:FkbM family methyltransferase